MFDWIDDLGEYLFGDDDDDNEMRCEIYEQGWENGFETGNQYGQGNFEY